jgi:hypothetical protein
MYVAKAVGTLKYAGYQHIADTEGYAADRALSLQISVNAERTALDVHQAVFAPGYGRKSVGFYQFTLVQFC